VRDRGTAKHQGVNHWLMLDLIERMIRLHACRLYEERGHAEGRNLADWLKAESEVLRTGVLAALWRSQYPRPSQKRAADRRNSRRRNPPPR